MADIGVLAKDAAEVAACKKYSARTAPADEDGFLAEMRAHRTNDRDITDTAKAYLPFVAVDFAVARTECAGICHIPQLLNGFTKGV